jgi:ribosomal protein L11 methylase PrmA
MVVVEKMLELGGIDKDDVLFDLGCGDGRIVITAAKKFGTRGVGIDIDPQRIEESLRAAKEAGVERLVEFRLQDVMKADIREATAVTLYLLPESNALLRPLLEAQLKPGTPVVSHNYSIPGWEEKEVTYVTLQNGTGLGHTIFAYRR